MEYLGKLIHFKTKNELKSTFFERTKELKKINHIYK
jgi:hypothetical protein